MVYLCLIVFKITSICKTDWSITAGLVNKGDFLSFEGGVSVLFNCVFLFVCFASKIFAKLQGTNSALKGITLTHGKHNSWSAWRALLVVDCFSCVTYLYHHITQLCNNWLLSSLAHPLWAQTAASRFLISDQSGGFLDMSFRLATERLKNYDGSSLYSFRTINNNNTILGSAWTLWSPFLFQSIIIKLYYPNHELFKTIKIIV